MTSTHVTRTRALAMQGVLLGALLAAACDPNKALDVKDIDVVQPGQINDKSALPDLRNGVLSTFQLAFSGGADLANGGHEGQVNMSGLLGDEFLNAESFPDRVSRRHARHHSVEPVARLALSRPEPRPSDRRLRIDAATTLSTPAPTDSRRCSASPRIAYVLFGENYCSGVPFSTADARPATSSTGIRRLATRSCRPPSRSSTRPSRSRRHRRTPTC